MLGRGGEGNETTANKAWASYISVPVSENIFQQEFFCKALKLFSHLSDCLLEYAARYTIYMTLGWKLSVV